MNDDKAKEYFLGKLDESEAENFVIETASSGELTEHARMIESELLEAYLRGGLSADESRLFEKNYLITEARRQKLRFAQVLQQNINSQTDEFVPQISFWEKLFAFKQLKIAFAAIILIGFSAAMFWLLKSDSKKETEIVEQKNTAPTPTPKIENQRIEISPTPANNTQKTNNSPVNKPLKEPSPTAMPKPAQPIFASFTLLPGALRNEGEQFIKLLPNTNKVNLRLSLPKEAAKYDTYSISVKNANGETVFSAENSKSTALTVPAAKLENDVYIIFLKGNNPQKNAESIAEYTFRVSR